MAEKRTQLAVLIDFMKGRDKVTLKEMFEGTAIKPHSVRSLLNAYIQQGKHFEKVSRGTYKLK
jgi:hypothetical protein